MRSEVKSTKNYKEHQRVIAELSITDIIHVVDYVNLLSLFLNRNNETLDNKDTILEPLNKVIERLRTDENCRHNDCDSDLYKSDLPQYDYVCSSCDENF